MQGKMATSSDYYQTSSPWYYILQVVMILYGIGAIAYLVILQNENVPNTYFRTLPGGTHFSLKYVSFQWVVLMLSAIKIIMYCIVNTMILYRSSRGCSVLWFIIIILIAFVDVITVVGLGQFYSRCNQVGQLDNPCNDDRWCCAPEIYTVPTHNCPNTVACAAAPVASLSELTSNIDFRWLFWVNFVFMIADLFFAAFFAGMFGTGERIEESKHERTKSTRRGRGFIPEMEKAKIQAAVPIVHVASKMTKDE